MCDVEETNAVNSIAFINLKDELENKYNLTAAYSDSCVIIRNNEGKFRCEHEILDTEAGPYDSLIALKCDTIYNCNYPQCIQQAMYVNDEEEEVPEDPNIEDD
jgi:hypothetical protein